MMMMPSLKKLVWMWHILSTFHQSQSQAFLPSFDDIQTFINFKQIFLPFFLEFIHEWNLSLRMELDSTIQERERRGFYDDL